MGIRVKVGGIDYQVSDYSVEEQATPLAAGDPTGSVGVMEFSLPLPDPDIHPDHPIVRYGPEWMIGQEVEILSDSRYGFTLGVVDAVAPAGGQFQVSCLSRLGELNIFNVRAQPYVGTLKNAFEYYARVAGITSGVVVDESVANRLVSYPGFTGELWYHLKQMAAAQDCDISLVSGTILLRPIRIRVAERGRTIQRAGQTGVGQLARAIEIYWYKTKAITDELVYPPGGWNPEVEILNVNAGETLEYTLELSSSLTHFQVPEMVTSVDQYYSDSSVYTVVADDGFPVPPDAWHRNGGKVEITLNPDTTSLNVVLTGALNIFTSTGEPSKSFSLALEAVGTGARYSTLRIVGSGVEYDRQLKRIRTGVSEGRTGTEVGLTIDNPFINDLNTLYKLGTRAAKNFSGNVSTTTAEVTSVNARGESGEKQVMSYEAVKDSLAGTVGPGASYRDISGFYEEEGFRSYADVLEWWESQTANDFSNQTFGNVQGARIWDPSRKRWFRIRSATVGPSGISVGTADDDLTIGDVNEFFRSKNYTYDDVQNLRNGLTYDQERMVGLRV